ncbi:MAG: Do family serine endopeptidase [bacterium]
MPTRQSAFSGYKMLVFAVVMLAAGFIFGTLQYKPGFFTFAQDDTSKDYKGQSVDDVERPEEAMETAKQLQDAINYASERSRPAVVTIYTRKQVQAPGFPFQAPQGDPRFDEFFRRFFNTPEPRSREVTGLGSGVIIRSEGYILTNHHVVAQADEIEVLLANGENIKAEVIGEDKESDLAVLKVDRTNLPTMDFADSDKIEVGDYAIAVGSPFQLENSVSVGHVSALHRAINAQRFEDLIQTDAAINRGNSGGPLINIEGEIIGINTLILSEGSQGNQGVGFAISANLAKRTASDLIEYGKVRRPWLGVVIQEITSEMARHVDVDKGVIVAEVKDGSPADEAGIESGDVILKFNGKTIKTPHDLQRRVLAQNIGDEVQVTLKKQGDGQVTLTVTLAELPGEDESSSVSGDQDAQQQSPEINKQLGLGLKQLTADEAKKAGVVPPRPVLQITEIQRGKPAHQANLRPGDVILRVGEQQVTSREEFNSLLAKAKEAGQKEVLLHVRRDSNFFTILPLK